MGFLAEDCRSIVASTLKLFTPPVLAIIEAFWANCKVSGGMPRWESVISLSRTIIPYLRPLGLCVQKRWGVVRGMHTASFLYTSNFVQIRTERQSMQAGTYDEVEYRFNWNTESQLTNHAKLFKKITMDNFKNALSILR